MFNKKSKMKAIALPLTDAYGNDNGIAVIFKDSVIGIFYNHNKGEMVINVKQNSFTIASKLLLAEEHTPVLSNGKLTPDRTGAPQTIGTKKYRNDIYINGAGGNEQIILTDEEEIRRFWNWLESDIDVQIFFDKRQQHLDLMEARRKEAEARKAEDLKKAEEVVKAKLSVVKDAASEPSLKDQLTTEEVQSEKST